ncbi:hypothetical protein HKX48_009334, partial [Thoreauomyces humboldtii]
MYRPAGPSGSSPGQGRRISSQSAIAKEKITGKLAKLGSKLFGGSSDERDRNSYSAVNEESLERAYEKMLDDRGITGSARAPMMGLDDSRKRQLLTDWQQNRRAPQPSSLSPVPALRGKSSIVSLSDDAEGRLERTFLRVLERLKIPEPAQITMVKTLDANKKAEIIEQYRRRRDIEKRREAELAHGRAHPAVATRKPPLVQVPAPLRASYDNLLTSVLHPHDLDATFRKVLDELDIRGSARDNMLKMDEARQRDVIRQYNLVRRKDSRQGAPERTLPPPGSSRRSSVVKAPPGVLPDCPERSDSLQKDAPGVFNALGEQTPQRFVALLANRNTPLKSLYRHLTAFRITLSLSGHVFIRDVVDAEVPYLGTHGVRGVEALETVLDRVAEAKRLRHINDAAPRSKRGPRPYRSYTTRRESGAVGGSAAGSYADALLEDELGLETVRCLKLIMKADVGCTAVLASPSLMKQLGYCLAAPQLSSSNLQNDTRVRRANLGMRTAVAEILGPMCLLSEQGRVSTLSAMADLASMQSEPARFNFVVHSLLDPFIAPADAFPVPRIEPPDSDDSSALWDYRTSVMIFFNGLISAPEDSKERWLVRREVEQRGIRTVMKTLRSLNGITEALRIQLEAYEEDRLEDLEILDEGQSGRSASLGDPRVIMADLLETAKTLPEPDRAHNLLVSSVDHMAKIVGALQKRNMGRSSSSGGISASSIVSAEEDLQAREESAEALALVNRTMESISKQLMLPAQGTGSVSREVKFQALASNLLQSVEDVAGVPVRRSYFATTDGTPGSLDLIRELENTQRQYIANLALADAQRKELDYLRRQDGTRPLPQVPSTDGDAAPPLPPRKDSTHRKRPLPLPSFSFEESLSEERSSDSYRSGTKLPASAGVGRLWEEIRRLEDVVAELRSDRADASMVSKPLSTPTSANVSVAIPAVILTP